MANKNNIYESWERDNLMDDKLQTIIDYYSNKERNGQIHKTLGVSMRTWMRIKKKPEVVDAINEGLDTLKNTLVNSIYKRAIGFTIEESETVIEESKSGMKKKLVKTKKEVIPDWNAARYLLDHSQ